MFKIDPIKSSVKLEVTEKEILIWPEAEEESTYPKKPVVILSFNKTIPEKDAWKLTYLLSEYLDSISIRNTSFENLIE